MSYTEQNRQAWQEAFAVHQRGYGHDLADDLRNPEHSFLDAPVIAILDELDIRGMHVAQFCCNNGRELLQMVKTGAASGVGFDFAENYVQEGNRLSAVTGLNTRFVASDIAEIPAQYDDAFDLILITAGALTWFENLNTFFDKVASTLQQGGVLLIHEMHPVCNMLAMPNEEEYDEDNPGQFVYSYFRDEPWIDSEGMDYVGGTSYKSKTFYSYSHSMGEILTTLAQNGIHVERLQEYPDDISNSFTKLTGNGIPLSYVLVARLK